MAKPVKPLTDYQIKQAKIQEKEYTLTDGQGLLLRVRPSGVKAWLFKYYRPLSKKRTNMSLGHYPAVSLAHARKLRDEARALLSNHIDPQVFREQQARELARAQRCTLQQVAQDWFAVKQHSVTADYADDIWRSLERHVFPALGKVPIKELRAEDAIQQLQPIAASGKLEMVKRVCQRLNEVMVYAVNTGRCEHNPLAGIRAAFQAPRKQAMPTIDSAELPQLLRVLHHANIMFTTRCLIEFQLHTMTRPKEAAHVQWQEIDWDSACWVIPATRMKARKEHIVPLSAQALDILSLMQDVSGDAVYIFPADRDRTKPMHSQTANAALKRMGYASKLVAHGLRALASTTLNESQAFSPELIEAALAHQDKNQVRAAYNRAQYIKPRRAMMQWWSDRISEAKRQGLGL